MWFLLGVLAGGLVMGVIGAVLVAKALAQQDSAERWEAFHRAVADVPESQQP